MLIQMGLGSFRLSWCHEIKEVFLRKRTVRVFFRSPVGLSYACLLRIGENSHDRGETLVRLRCDGRRSVVGF